MPWSKYKLNRVDSNSDEFNLICKAARGTSLHVTLRLQSLYKIAARQPSFEIQSFPKNDSRLFYYGTSKREAGLILNHYGFFLCKAFRDRPLIQKSSSEPFGFGYYFTTLIPPSMEIPSVKNRTDITQPRGSYSCARLKISETILEPKSYALSF